MNLRQEKHTATQGNSGKMKRLMTVYDYISVTRTKKKKNLKKE